MAALESLRPQLDDICDRLTLPLSDGQKTALLGYLDLLLRWNSAYNLTAVREPQRMLTQHVADCLAVVGPLCRHAVQQPLRILDVGSGGGLPGALLAICDAGFDVTAVDAVGKKAAFIRQVAGVLALPNLHAEHGRVETLRPSQPFPVIVSRAFSSLAEFTRLTRPLLAPAGVWLAMKGKDPVDERRRLPAEIDVFHVEHLLVPGLDAERCLVWMRLR